MKRLLLIFLCLILVISVFSFSLPIKQKAFAENKACYDIKNSDTRGLFVTLSISLSGENGQVSTIAKHDFSIFSSTVIVYLYLYCSDTYQESYTNMTLVASNYTSDLDFNETLTASYSTNNQQKYWQGRMYYKIGNQSWQNIITGTFLYDGSGNCLN